MDQEKADFFYGNTCQYQQFTRAVTSYLLVSDQQLHE